MEKQAEITIKELFERLVGIETRFEEKGKRDDRITMRFTWFVVVLVILNIFNIFIHLLLMRL